jgi:hypothetical protein
MSDHLKAIIQQHWITPEGAEWIPKVRTIPRAEIEEWMASSDIELLGYAAAMMDEARMHIEPSLSTEKFVGFQMRYLERCLRENPNSEWADSAYSAGWTIVRLFIKLWDDKGIPRSHLFDLKAWIARLYKSADTNLRTCLVHATLEHLFERPAIRKYFLDWKTDPLLSEAHSQACLWTIKTPLSRK